MLAIHARAFYSDVQLAGIDFLSLDDAVAILDADTGPEADSRVRRAIANLWAYRYGLPSIRTAIESLLHGRRALDFAKIDLQLKIELAAHDPPITLPAPPLDIPVVEVTLLDLLVTLTPDCPYDVPAPIGGVADDPTNVMWSYDVTIPRAMQDVARSLDPQSWDETSAFFYNSYLADVATSCCPHTGSSDCSFTNLSGPDPPAGKSYARGAPYAPTPFFETFCGGNSCPTCGGQSCLAVFKNILCVDTAYEPCVLVPCLAGSASGYTVRYGFAKFLSGQASGADTGPITADWGTLSVRPATAAETSSLPGTPWSVVHVDKTLRFQSGAFTVGAAKIMKSMEKELGDRIVEQACHNVASSFWFSWCWP